MYNYLRGSVTEAAVLVILLSKDSYSVTIICMNLLGEVSFFFLDLGDFPRDIIKVYWYVNSFILTWSTE